MTRNIMIACPSNAGTPDYTTALSINRATMEAAERGWRTNVVFRVKDSMITRARNVIFSMFFASDCTDLLFIDDDIGCAPGSFLRLMDHPVELVGGAYRSRRGDLEDYVMRPLEGGMLQFDPEQKTGLMEVEAVPTGFMRITRACAERMVRAYSDQWCTDSTAPEGLAKIYCVFDFKLDVETHTYWSEDYLFCKRFREIGGKVWVDPFLDFTHTGKDQFKGSLIEYLKRKCAPAEAQIAPAQTAPATLLDAARGCLEAAE